MLRQSKYAKSKPTLKIQFEAKDMKLDKKLRTIKSPKLTKPDSLKSPRPKPQLPQ